MRITANLLADDAWMSTYSNSYMPNYSQKVYNSFVSAIVMKEGLLREIRKREVGISATVNYNNERHISYPLLILRTYVL